MHKWKIAMPNPVSITSVIKSRLSLEFDVSGLTRSIVRTQSNSWQGNLPIRPGLRWRERFGDAGAYNFLSWIVVMGWTDERSGLQPCTVKSSCGTKFKI